MYSFCRDLGMITHTYLVTTSTHFVEKKIINEGDSGAHVLRIPGTQKRIFAGKTMLLNARRQRARDAHGNFTLRRTFSLLRDTSNYNLRLAFERRRETERRSATRFVEIVTPSPSRYRDISWFCEISRCRGNRVESIATSAIPHIHISTFL